MAKALKTVGKIAQVASVVLAFIPGGQPFAAAASAISAVAATGGQLLAQPAPLGGDTSKVTINTDAETPYIMGRTLTGGVLVHDVGYGADRKKIPNPNRSLVHVYSDCGPVNQIEGSYADGAFIVSSGHPAPSSYYNDEYHYRSQIGTVPETTALTGGYGAIPNWTSAHKLSGKAAAVTSLRWDKKQEKFAGGLPLLQAMLQGVLAYDPRQDSTYPGGSGPCRLGDESTYIYTQNPGPHAITYAFGRYQNGVRVYGIGKQESGIDMAAFVEWSNVCDANGWQIGGEIKEPGDKWNNLKSIMQVGSARPTHKSGVLSVTFDAPRVSVATFTEDDLADGDGEIVGGKSFRDRINSVVPRVRSPQHNYEMVPGSPFTVDQYVTDDGELKRREVQFSLCQSFPQGAQLAGYVLMNTRELDDITLPMKIGVIHFGPGEAVDLNMPNYGLQGQFIIVSRRFDPLSSTFEMTFKSETPAKHPFALGATTTPPELPRLVFGPEIDRIVSAASGQNDTIENLITTSWVDALGFVSTVGADANSSTITITDHQRIYGDDVVDVTGADIPNLENETLYAIYYDDFERAGGEVSYQVTKDLNVAQNKGDVEGRHFVGFIETPAIGGSETTGVGATPPSLTPLRVPFAESLNGLSRDEIETRLDGVDDLVDDAIADAAAALDEAEDVRDYAQDQIALVNDRVDDAIGDIGDVQSDITDLESTKADTSALTTEAERITALTSRVSTGPNLLLNSSFADGDGGWNIASRASLVADAYGPRLQHLDTNALGVNRVSTSNQFPIEPGDYTLSFDLFSEAAGNTSYVDVLIRDANGALVLDVPQTILTTAKAFGERNVTTFTVPSGGVTAQVRYITRNYNNAPMSVRRIKLEAGSVATLWTDDATISAAHAGITSLENTKADGTALTAEANRITALTSRVDSAEDDLGDVQSDITSLENTKADASALTTEANRLSALTSRVDGAEDDLGDIQSDITSLENTKADGADLTTEANRITALTSRVDSAEDDLGDVQSDIIDLENTKADGADLTTEANRITALTSQIFTPPNLLKNSGFLNGEEFWNLNSRASIVDDADGPRLQHLDVAANGVNRITSSDTFPIEPGDHVISFDLFSAAAGNTSYVDVLIRDANGALVLDVPQTILTTAKAFGERTVRTFTVPEGGFTAQVRYITRNHNNAPMSVRRIKVEKGSVATLWTSEASVIADLSEVRQTAVDAYGRTNVTWDLQGSTSDGGFRIGGSVRDDGAGNTSSLLYLNSDTLVAEHDNELIWSSDGSGMLHNRPSRWISADGLAMTAMGNDFGTNADLMIWSGAAAPSTNNCRPSNAGFALTTSGQVYINGQLQGGNVNTGAASGGTTATTDLQNANGTQADVSGNGRLSGNQQVGNTSSAPPWSTSANTATVTAILEVRVAGGAWQALDSATTSTTVSYSSVQTIAEIPGDSPAFYLHTRSYDAIASLSHEDYNTATGVDYDFRVRVTGQITPGFGAATCGVSYLEEAV